MVSNGENIFQKTQKYRKHVEKAQGIGKNWACTSSPQSTSWHPARLRPVYPILCFRAFHESVLTLFFNKKKKKKKGCANKVSQNLHVLSNWGI